VLYEKVTRSRVRSKPLCYESSGIARGHDSSNGLLKVTSKTPLFKKILYARVVSRTKVIPRPTTSQEFTNLTVILITVQSVKVKNTHHRSQSIMIFF
jgi:hypothetical protein